MDGKRSSQVSKVRPMAALAIASYFCCSAKSLKIGAKCAGGNPCPVDPWKEELTLRFRALLPRGVLLRDSDEVPPDWDAPTGFELATSKLDDAIPKINVLFFETCYFADARRSMCGPNCSAEMPLFFIRGLMIEDIEWPETGR